MCACDALTMRCWYDIAGKHPLDRTPPSSRGGSFEATLKKDKSEEPALAVSSSFAEEEEEEEVEEEEASLKAPRELMLDRSVLELLLKLLDRDEEREAVLDATLS